MARFERKPRFAAEALCLVYAHAARAALTFNFEQRQDALCTFDGGAYETDYLPVRMDEPLAQFASGWKWIGGI